MKHRKYLLLVAIIVLLFTLSGFTDGNTYLVCPHRLVSEPAYESSHPHNQYVVCNSCGERIYTGSHLTKPHGNGTGGTCSKCGIHTYIGRTCTNNGVCSCGATIAPSSHILESVQYSNATHPHAYYRYCSVCNAKVYTSGYATKNHGDGTWGSGTCPDCGTHTYTGQSCTSVGSCVCGATTPALNHTLEDVVYSDATHPHAKYKFCTVCWHRVYIGGYVVKNHGDGTFGSGTCPDCGEHTYHSGISALSHPHQIDWSCSCGDYYHTYALDEVCNICKSDLRIANNTESRAQTFRYTAGDLIDCVVFTTLTCYVDYYNEYNDPSKISIIDYGYPVFASYHSYVNAYTEEDLVYLLPMTYYVPFSVDYYNSTGQLITSQKMIPHGPNYVLNSTPIFTLYNKPAYTSTFALFWLDESTSSVTIPITTYFDYS